jgi:uncharacterized protein
VGHWQTWLEGQYKDTVRVEQDDWADPDLPRWSERIEQTLALQPPHTHWVAVAHSFGCLAWSHYMARQIQHGRSHPIAAAMLVAPADPEKFQLKDALPSHNLGVKATMVGSENDPWMPLARAQSLGQQWGAEFLNLGPCGHINTESGHGPWPLARLKVDQFIRYASARAQRLALPPWRN